MATISLTTVSNLFKQKFGPITERLYNSDTVLLARVKKNYKFSGSFISKPAPNKQGGSVGSGSLPTANALNPLLMEIRAKKLYAVAQVDRESMKASQEKEGAYVEMLKEAADKATQSWRRNLNRILLNDLDNGAVGYTSGSSAGTASVPIITVTTASWKAANWELGDYVNVNTDSSVFEVTSVVESTKAVTLTRISGSLDLTSIGAGTHKVYIQNSKDNDPESIVGVLRATSGTKYNVSIGNRFQAVQEDASSAAVSEDLMTKVMLKVEQNTGKVPNLILCSFEQLRKLHALFPSAKQYNIQPRDERLIGKISMSGMEFLSSKGPVPIVADRFVAADTILFLNDNMIEIHHRPDFGWFEDDGTVFLRDASADSYSARYGGYLQVECVPSFHGILYGLAT